MASNGNNNTTDVSVSVSFLAEMARIVGSTGDYLIFDGQDEAVDFLRGNDYTIFTDEDDITEWVKENKAVEDVFDNEEMITYISDACSPDEVFEENQLAEWVGYNCDAVDVFSAEDIKQAYKHLVNTGDITEEAFGVSVEVKEEYHSSHYEKVLKPRHQADEVRFVGIIHSLKEDNEQLTADNEALKAEIATLKQAITTVLKFAS